MQADNLTLINFGIGLNEKASTLLKVPQSKRQRQTISEMEAQIQSLQRSVQELVDYKISKQAVKEQQHAWQQSISTQLREDA